MTQININGDESKTELTVEAGFYFIQYPTSYILYSTHEQEPKIGIVSFDLKSIHYVNKHGVVGYDILENFKKNGGKLIKKCDVVSFS